MGGGNVSFSSPWNLHRINCNTYEYWGLSSSTNGLQHGQPRQSLRLELDEAVVNSNLDLLRSPHHTSREGFQFVHETVAMMLG